MDWRKRLMGLIETLSARAVGRSTHLAEVNKGRWTKPVKASAGRVAWPAYEVEAQIAARIAGKTDTEIQQLVRHLEAARQQVVVTLGQVDSLTTAVKEAAKPGLEGGLACGMRKRKKRSVEAAHATGSK